MARSRSCIVERCQRNGVEDLPLDDDSTLALPVCAPHARAIEHEPGAWRVTSLPIAQSRQYRTVVIPVRR